MKPGWILLLVAALVATVSILSWRLGYRATVAELVETPKPDTLIVRDTVTVEFPVPILTTITDTILVAYPDIVIIHDTTFVQLPKERKEYSGKDYRAVVSGFQPSLDLIQVFPETKTITQDHFRPVTKKVSLGHIPPSRLWLDPPKQPHHSTPLHRSRNLLQPCRMVNITEYFTEYLHNNQKIIIFVSSK